MTTTEKNTNKCNENKIEAYILIGLISDQSQTMFNFRLQGQEDISRIKETIPSCSMEGEVHEHQPNQQVIK